MSFISIVMCGSNEDYGGNFLARMQTCLDSIFIGAERHGLDADLLLIDWGTPPNRRDLAGAINWSRCRIPARVVMVPKQVIATIPNPYGIRFFEPWAKSVGVRRATGQWILTTNADSIYSDELMARLARHDLDPKCVYRVNRYDKDAAGRIRFVQRANGEFAPDEPWEGVNRTGVEYRENMPHYNAAGQFILMTREKYHAIRGWPETTYWAHVDSMVLYLAFMNGGLRQIILDEPLYHQDHPRGNHPFVPAWSDAHPWAVENGDNWGFRGREFETREVGQKVGVR